MKNDMGLKIAGILKQQKMRQKDLAAQTGITVSAISRYIAGERAPRADELARIAAALYTSSDYLLGIASDIIAGRWEWHEKWYDNECIDCGWECSICHVALEDIVGGDWGNRFDPPKLGYCPNCGAKMADEKR